MTIDFLRPSGSPPVGWVVCAMGLLALLAALWCGRQWSADRRRAEEAAQHALAERRSHLAPPPAALPPLSQRRWQQAQAELQRPWWPAMRAIESATVDPVYLLGMTIDPGKGTIKLDAEAPSFDHALAYVQVLDVGAALQPAMLVSHEQVSAGEGGAAAVRFSVATQWVTRQAQP